MQTAKVIGSQIISDSLGPAMVVGLHLDNSNFISDQKFSIEFMSKDEGRDERENRRDRQKQGL